ncbi:hypothetical protein B6S12_04505 [Helicobacter valdiviensis]|uniref:ATPase n=1 Tax=Helicobacter valdiviensis TaxID=1458358 RepID=A0A2W6MUW6_9HELI|nr:ATP-binding protein [Helicobacter valdiviensis]PZT48325.1 hypothetical protein B6S12_04505 [Helicobacter valdiviensis]
MLLEQIFENYPKNSNKFHRKISLNLSKKTLVFGAPFLGKSDYVLNFFEHKDKLALKKLYIDLVDIRLNNLEFLKDLSDFCSKTKIDLLIINHYSPTLLPISFLPAIENIILISNIHYSIPSFTALEFPPILFNEFKQFFKGQEQEIFHQYLKKGTLFIEDFNEEKKVNLLKLLSKDTQELWIFKSLILSSGLKVSPHQIYTKLKKEGKISKDRFYGFINTLEEQNILFWVRKFEHALAPKKLYFWDFSLKNSLSFQKDFSTLFENMVFLELYARFKDEIFYTDKIDFYIPSLSLGILCMPFIQNLETKLSKITKEREFCESFLILSLSQKEKGENLGTPYKILPFSEFAIKSFI